VKENDSKLLNERKTKEGRKLFKISTNKWNRQYRNIAHLNSKEKRRDYDVAYLTMA
jgi:hypothetical protein